MCLWLCLCLRVCQCVWVCRASRSLVSLSVPVQGLAFPFLFAVRVRGCDETAKCVLRNPKEDGGFHCVPGAHSLLSHWAAATKDSHLARSPSATFNIIDQMDPTSMSRDAQHIAMRAGSLLLWSFETPHGSTPNRSLRPRIAQFLKVVDAAAFEDQGTWGRRQRVVQQMIKESACHTTSLGLRMLGAERWADANS
mmetsp:Transcript_48002/g.98080  ORF Transcript_48002/g.98080 Transcript_48002/m.98080 type:complete len:195 (+) Transcript_48002:769-1353(+)